MSVFNGGQSVSPEWLQRAAFEQMQNQQQNVGNLASALQSLSPETVMSGWERMLADHNSRLSEIHQELMALTERLFGSGEATGRANAPPLPPGHIHAIRDRLSSQSEMISEIAERIAYLRNLG